jgi:hypothetical protein
MSSAIHDFFTSELKLFRCNCIVITVVSDNAKPLSWFEHNIKGHPSLKCSSISTRSAPTSGSKKKDHRWGETLSLDCQWDSSPGHVRYSSRPLVADSANATDNSSKNEVQHISPAQIDISCSTMNVNERLTFEARSDQAILKDTSHIQRQDMFAARQTAPPPRMMCHEQSSSPVPLLRTPSNKNWRSKQPPQYMCDKQADNVAVNNFKELGHRSAMEIKKKKGGQESPLPPQRRNSISSMAA